MSEEPVYLTGDAGRINAFLDRFDVFLFDCDGVLWSGDQLFDGTVETLDKLRRRGKQVVFVTNNSTKSRADYVQKLSTLGISATIDEVFSSSYSAAIYISRIAQLPADKRTVFILGESGIEAELRSEGIPFIGGTDPAYQRTIESADFKALAAGTALDKSVGAVLCGLDFHLNYLKLAYAYQYIMQQGTLFLATNSDTTLPNSSSLFPGAGACAAPLVAALGGSSQSGSGGKNEPLTLGKPSQAMMDAVASKFNFDRQRTCMVGDRLNTDIRFGIEGRLGGTLCVLTGVTKSAEEWSSGAEQKGKDLIRPSAWADKLSDLLVGLS